MDPSALLRQTERHTDPGYGHAARIAKLAEGGFNRVSFMSMDDGFEAIAKLPYRVRGTQALRHRQ